MPPAGVDAFLELKKGGLPDDSIQHVLDLAGEQVAALPLVGGFRQELAESQHFAEDTGGFGESQGRVGHQVAVFCRQYLMDTVAELMGQRHDVAGFALVVQQ